jgi:hypothetical protein
MRERSRRARSTALSAEKNTWLTQTGITRTTTVLKTLGNVPRLRGRSAHAHGIFTINRVEDHKKRKKKDYADKAQ